MTSGHIRLAARRALGPRQTFLEHFQPSAAPLSLNTPLFSLYLGLTTRFASDMKPPHFLLRFACPRHHHTVSPLVHHSVWRTRGKGQLRPLPGPSYSNPGDMHSEPSIKITWDSGPIWRNHADLIGVSLQKDHAKALSAAFDLYLQPANYRLLRRHCFRAWRQISDPPSSCILETPHIWIWMYPLALEPWALTGLPIDPRCLNHDSCHARLTSAERTQSGSGLISWSSFLTQLGRWTVSLCSVIC